MLVCAALCLRDCVLRWVVACFVGCCMIDGCRDFFRGLGLGVLVSVTLTEALFRGLCAIGLGVDFFCVIIVGFWLWFVGFVNSVAMFA